MVLTYHHGRHFHHCDLGNVPCLIPRKTRTNKNMNEIHTLYLHVPSLIAGIALSMTCTALVLLSLRKGGGE